MSKFILDALREDEPTVVEPTGDPMETMLALESASHDITESFHEVAMSEMRQEELEGAHASLESIAASIAAVVAKDERGLDAMAAEGYALAVKGIVGEALPQPIASLESFGGDSERLEATQLSLEGLKENIQKIWEAIKRAIESAIKAVTDFVTKLFGGVKKLEDRLGQLKQEIDNAKKNNLTADGKVRIGNAAKLAMNGNFDVKTIESGIQVVHNNVATTAEQLAIAGDQYYSAISKKFMSKMTEKEDADKFFEVDGMLQSSLSKIKVVKDELPGGKALTVESKVLGTGAEESLNLSEAVSLGDHPRARDYKGDGEIDVPSLDQLEKLRGALEKLVSTLGKGKDKREALTKARKDVKDAADKWVKDNADGKFAEMVGQTKINFMLRRANADMASVVTKTDNYVYSYARTVLAAISTSLDAYGAKSGGDE